jgi:hypothetical protein
LENVVANKLDLNGGTMVGDIAMNGRRVINLPLPLTNNEATSKAYVDSKFNIDPPLPTASSILTNINMSTANMTPASMRAVITDATGGENKCWGHTAVYVADVDLLAGRVVALADQIVGSDNTSLLRVGYLRSATETDPTVCPIGVTQENVLAGEPVTICIHGYTTVICSNTDTSPERGSQVMNGTSDLGRVRINKAGGANEARLGFVAQSDTIAVPNSPCLIYFAGWFQPY